MTTLAELGLTDFPFRIVPDEEYQTRWADRKEILQAIEKHVKPFTQSNPSEVLFFWGYFGTGKSHALRYFGHKVETSTKGLPVYVDLLGCKPDNFLNVYLELIRNLKFDSLAECIKELVGPAGGGEANNVVRTVLKDPSSDILSALSALAKGDRQKETAVAWFQGSTLTRPDKDLIGVRDKLKTDSQAIGAVAGIHDVLSAKNRFLMLMFDEYQTLSELAGSRLMKIQQGLTGLFNRCPKGLIMIIAFTGRQEGAMYDLIPDILRQRALPDSRINMPPMQKEEGRIFVRDLLNIYRAKGIGGTNIYYPFTDESVSRAIDWIIETRQDLTPRTINIALHQVIQAALQGRNKPPIGPASIDAILANPT